MDPPVVQRLHGDRLHLSHGPIDVVLRAWGAPAAVRAAEDAAARDFPAILPGLVAELPELRRAMAERPRVRGPVARRMVAACAPFTPHFLTPMAAVAGAVADALLAAMLRAAPLDRAYVNDGGDIAVHVAPAESLAIGLVADPARPEQYPIGSDCPIGFPALAKAGSGAARVGSTELLRDSIRSGAAPGFDGALRVAAGRGIGGIATSGRHGRSFSLGIADAVTVLARDAATADAAATLVANAVDIDSAAIRRAPAASLDPDSDLGARLVTVAVGPLAQEDVAAALAAGLARAEAFRAAGLIIAAALRLAGAVRIAGAPTLLAP
jgi:ApbE superfamily uncharacterized protein (UPF0280 family)